MESRRSIRNSPRIASVVFPSHLCRLARKPFVSSEELPKPFTINEFQDFILAPAVLRSFPSLQLQSVPNS